MILHENRLPADDSQTILMKYHALFVILEKKKKKKKQQNLKLSSAANYRWRYSSQWKFPQSFCVFVCVYYSPYY